MAIHLIHTISTHKIIYAVESAEDLSDLNNQADLQNLLSKEIVGDLSQEWKGESIETVGPPLSNEDFIKVHDVIYPDLKKDLTKEEKLSVVIPFDELHKTPLILDESEDF